MATISSVGVGTNGLDSKSIIEKLVELERKPLATLELSAAATKAKISAFGQIKSLTSTLNDAAGRLTSVTGWNSVLTTTSDDKTVTAQADSGTLPTSFDVTVVKLATNHAVATGSISPQGSSVGSGTLKLWAGAAPALPPDPAAVSIDIPVLASDSVYDIASKINGSNAGITATVLNDASGQRLLLSSKATGIESAFHLTVEDADGNSSDAIGLSRLVAGYSITQTAVDAEATVNGIDVTSSSNVFKNTVSGVSFTVSQLTTTPIRITVARDDSSVQKNIQDFVDAYNAINDVLNEATKYDSGTKQAGMLQGDSTTITLQNSLRNAVQAITTNSKLFSRLSDVGIEMLQGGNLSVNSTKLSQAMSDNMEELKIMFRSTSLDSSTGIANQIKNLTTNLLSTDGFFQSKDSSLQRSLKQNAKDQLRVNEKADAFEKRITAQYSALDSKMSTLNALNAYVTQQITTWNKSTG